MDYFNYRDGSLFCEETPVSKLADEFGTPLWVYSQRTILHHYDRIAEAFQDVDPLICYSVKANGNLSVLRLLAERGSGFDVVSGGELKRAVEAGGDPGKMVFAGVAKTNDEIRAGLDAGLLMLNVENEDELGNIAEIAGKLGKKAPIALRVNPDVDPKTHRYITTGKKETKFGMDIDTALKAARDLAGADSMELIGLHMHVGSQITSTDPYSSALEKGMGFLAKFRELGHNIQWLNIGGGFGIDYHIGEARTVVEFARQVIPFVKESGCRLALEPGRFVMGNAGILVSEVMYQKEAGDKTFVIQDGAMNDLLRPALYEAYHRIWPVEPGADNEPPESFELQTEGAVTVDIVGPVCESGDFLAKDRPIPPVQRGDRLSTFSAGAYGIVMSSNYNARPRGAEVLVDGESYRLIRRRETYDDLFGPERLDG